MISLVDATRSLPVADRCDVLVVGGGTAGSAAAITAARAHADTLVVERYGCLGGTMTLALVTPMMANHLQGKYLSRGLHIEILERAAELEPPPSGNPEDARWFNPIALQFLLDEMLVEAGGRALFEAYVSDVVVDPGQPPRVCGVVVETKSGRQVLIGEVTIDCSGDADVANLAHVPMQRGDDQGRNQPMSLRFNLANVDIKRVAAFFRDLDCTVADPPLTSVGFHESTDSPMASLVAQAIEDEVLHEGDLGYFQFFGMLGRPGELAFNCPRLSGYKADDASDRSRAWLEGRAKIWRIVRFCQKYLGGFEQSYLAIVAPMLGVRESRRIVGEYVLTEEDWFACRKFEDGIGRNRYAIDIHNPGGVGTTLHQMPPNEYHDIPFRCLVPVGVEGLLVAGRCVSATFAAQASIRVEANCRAMGQAAGEAAAMAAKAGGLVRSVSVPMLQQRLREAGALI